MGYYTDYKLTHFLPNHEENMEHKAFQSECEAAGIKIPDEAIKSLELQCSLEMEIEDAYNAEDACEYGALTGFVHGCDGCKWYNHENDMIKFSRRFPTVLFKLEGEGEESGDMWIKYFRNGKMQECRGEVIYPEFDESKLE